MALRALGDLVDGMTATRLDPPEVAAIKGSLRIRRLLSHDVEASGRAPTTFRAFVAGTRCGSTTTRCAGPLDVLRRHQHNLATMPPHRARGGGLALGAPGRARRVPRRLRRVPRRRRVHGVVVAADRRPELLLGSPTPTTLRRVTGCSTTRRAPRWPILPEALELGSWSVADAALVDDLVARLGPVQDAEREDVGFYDIEELDDLSA